MTIGEVISNRRKELKMTLEDVGNAVGVDRATVMRWEKGLIQKMGRDKISELSKILGLDPVIFCQPQEVLFSDERKLLIAYRNASHEAQGYAMDILEKSAAERKALQQDTASEQMA